MFASGVLSSPPPLSATTPRVHLKVGPAQGDVDVPAALSLEQLATGLQARINALPGLPGAMVATTRSQLLLIPGGNNPVQFGAVPNADDRTVVELQLHARFAVRVRVNGAESIDPADVDLPQ